MQKTKIFVVALLSVALSACASGTKDITAQYTSPMQYQDYSCQQLQVEMQNVSRRMSEVGGVVDNQASTDKAQMAIGIVLLWPTLFFLDGDTPQAAEYARLKGEMEAMDKAANQKNCGIKVQPVPAKAG